MKKFAALAVVVTLALSMGGCATAKKKFIRKKKEEVVRPVVFTEQAFVKEYTNKFYYIKHFNNWKTWNDELIDYLGRNAKRERRSFDEMISNLTSMLNYLKEPKRAELEAEIEKVNQLKDRLGAFTGRGADLSVRSDLESMRRTIYAKFDYEGVKEFVIPDEAAP